MISLTKPDLGDTETTRMIDAVRSGAIAQGSIAKKFEEACARWLGVDAGVATNSGTSALVLSLAVLGVARGSEVILPSYTCTAILNAVVISGAIPILVDNHDDIATMNFNLLADAVEEAITPATRAIIVPHMFGTAADVTAISALGLPVIEDITLAFGATTPDGRQVGSVGDLAVCSFHASKMVACGEGGMLLGRQDLARRARELNGSESEQVEQRFQNVSAPFTLQYGFRLSDVLAACGLAQVERLPETIARRRALARHYTEALGCVRGISLPKAEIPGCVFFRFIAQVSDRNPIDVLMALKDSGIEGGRGVYPPLHRLLETNPLSFPGAERAVCKNISIPLYPAIEDHEVEEVTISLRRALGAA